MGLNMCIEERNRNCQETTQLFGGKYNKIKLKDSPVMFSGNDLCLSRKNNIKSKKRKIKKLEKKIERLKQELK